MEMKVRKKKPSKIDPYRELVGTWPDSAIATKAGVTISAVRAFRKRYGIPAYSTQTPIQTVPRPAADPIPKGALRPERPVSKKSRSKVTAFKSDLGVLTDTAIAAKAGVTVGAVRGYRVRQGIASSTENRRLARQAAAPKAKDANRQPRPARPPDVTNAAPGVAAEPEVVTTNYVWSVSYGDDKSCLAGGADLAAAGMVLAKSGIHDVYKVKRLGRLLE